ncbi:DUF1214 domain-containing protein [Hyphomicrobium sulfonivorans]|uniref:DUF1214 domain-containing protein n=1 Tax=Hyphomicrobium sulfonivorans TaxID=121290 RepID=UPI00156F6D04|nr:DUF1214 domain-containing protein [Hyphomicrobium sulfonivorans]MBI1650840.1 DUF1214 domain-containing protein [Hyphomicrobium sulfonivorans]
MEHRSVLSHSARAPLSVVLNRLQKRVGIVVGILGDWAAFIGAVLILGLGTSWYMIDIGTGLTTERHGPWVAWTSAGRSDGDPYTRAHFARFGTLPLSSDIALTYTAFTDDTGERLHSSCEYSVEGRDIDDGWWSVTVFNDRGDLIANAADRHTYTRQTAAIRPDGKFAIALGREASPGNWLPTGGAGRLALQYTVFDAGASMLERTDDEPKALPAIRRVQCR